MAARKPAASKPAPRKAPTRSIAERTPLAEWVAAALGLALTLAAVGYLAWEGLTDDRTPPNLSVTAGAPQRADAGFTLPVKVRNSSFETAADVEIVGRLSAGGQLVEERRTHFSYVPGKGEAGGGLVFQHDPSSGQLELRAEGYAEP
ncbi:hypothetical protein [Phenylobacterium sp.]|jgi:uncharacterized protein (TIGR02588 family)|uniref:hypothetical protein n=1 Tax=Phenylobacterium sp. TaxID=1871053 RepID=UPI002F94611F